MTKRDARRGMPWKETAPWNERVKFITAHLEGDDSFSELCERFYEYGGFEALADRSRRPHG